MLRKKGIIDYIDPLTNDKLHNHLITQRVVQKIRLGSHNRWFLLFKSL